MKPKGKLKYTDRLAEELYHYFVTYQETFGAPSFCKFAAAKGLSTAELLAFRTHKIFDRAYEACREIRRDYLIDNALTKRFDPSFVKFLLGEETGTGCEADRAVTVTIQVVDG